MKGIIFNVLEDMVVAQCGMSVWNDLLEKHAPKDRVYVSAKSYAESELFSIVQDVAQRLNMPIQDVVKAFGQFLFNGLASRHAGVVEHFEDFTSLVMGIHDVIHLEVNKLYHEPSLPNITGQHLSDNQIALRYSSPRRLCFCAEGLLFGAAEHFKQKIQITHDTCMHTGADHCMLIIELQND
ncbi:heme NO-binding domain-containing protein [Shewanella xiamenensis]|uniref:heme NO-binding domain-containing protein n=1 Tax=Shewanella xiamenensis TaxID=332186 RepID=UPI0024A6FC5D|nr:heme NO-binding domain-containing protein [Shewanella xiamenensis]MDI5835312.1 heme NO-binding domain-containing protein [Shewanella xiamenensis]MDI5839298.1 heme NO-binding domain-containing protein [Shewanella xiamenensis]MDI5842742.1 heme NO-binding domain-containing protein [Shewanella xiamenensis]MDI5849508.1 heme NO-binding domain-containing protein [Shewanella xiamenensis]MDI5850623.1 heme NO-binding domain-containing protein [Shewanella xiamenensis]